MAISTYNTPKQVLAVTAHSGVEDQSNVERAERIAKYGNQKSKLEHRLQNMLSKSKYSGIEPRDFFKSDNSIKVIDTMTDSEVYLEWVNNFLSIERMSEYYSIDFWKLSDRINSGRIEHHRNIKG